MVMQYPEPKKPSDQHTSDDIYFEDWQGNKLGFVLANSSGRRDPRAIRSNPNPRTSTKISQGNTKWSDDTPPFSVAAQDDWSGGVGSEYLDEDSTRFFASKGMDTIHDGQLVLGPMPIYSNVEGYTISLWPWTSTYGYHMRDFGHDDNREGLAIRFHVPFAISSVEYVKVWLQRVGNPRGTLLFGIYNDNAGTLGTVIDNVQVYTHAQDASAEQQESKIDRFAGGLISVAMTTPTIALTADTWYWLVVRINGTADSSNYYRLLCLDEFPWWVGDFDTAGEPTGHYWTSDDNTTSISGNVYPCFVISQFTTDVEWTYFTFKGSLYGLLYNFGTGTSKLFINGDQGVVTSATSLTLTDSTKTWVARCFQECAVVIMAGKNADSRRAWSRVGLSGYDAISMTDPWTITPDTTSEYAIVGANWWREITGLPAGLSSKRCKDILSVGNVVYFAMGKDSDLVRMRRYNSAGTWNTEWVTETGNRADFLEAVVQDGVTYVWKGINSDYYQAQVAKATAVYGGGSGTIANLSFGTAIDTFPIEDRINGLEAYGDPETLWILKEGSIGYIYDDKYYSIPLKEMETVKDWRNGRASTVHSVYLYFGLLNSLERYYKSNLDDIGPNRSNGVPWDLQGPIVGLDGFPGMLYAAISGNLYPNVMAYNQLGWHEVVRLEERGRIDGISFQAVPVPYYPEMLWIETDTPVHVHISSSTLNPWYNTKYLPVPAGYLVTSWIDTGVRDREKIYESITLYSEGLKRDYTEVDIYVQWDQSGPASHYLSNWYPLDPYNNAFNLVPSQTKVIDPQGVDGRFRVTARRARFMIVLRHTNSAPSGEIKQYPRVKAIVVDTVVRFAMRWVHSFNFLIASRYVNGEWDSQMDVRAVVDRLMNWSEQTAPLMFYTVSQTQTRLVGWLDAFSWQPITIEEDGVEVLLGNASFVELGKRSIGPSVAFTGRIPAVRLPPSY